MNFGFRNRLAAANPLQGCDGSNASSQEGVLHREMDLGVQNLSLNDCDGNFASDASERAASIYGGVAAPVREIPQTPANFPEERPLAAPQIGAPALPNWSVSLQTVLDRPPASFTSRVMVAGLVFCAAFAGWAWLGQIEEVGHARGRLVPLGEVYKIHPVELGKVANVAVKEGEAIKAGAVLVELDTQLFAGEVQRLEEQLKSYQVELNQKLSLLEKARLEAGTRAAIAEADIQAQKAGLVAAREKAATASQLLEALRKQVIAHQARLERLQPLLATNQKLIEQLQGDARSASGRLQRLKPLAGTSEELKQQLQADVEAAAERVERLKPLVEEGAISKEFLFQAEQALRDRQSAIARNELQEGASLKEQLFQAEQGLSSATRAITQTQLQEGTNLKEQLFAAEQALRESRQSITQTEGETQQAKAQAEQLQAVVSQKQAEAQRIQLEAQQQIQQLEVELTALKAKIVETQNLLHSANVKLKERFLKAPADGVVLSLNVSKPGEVVQPAQTVAEIAPHGAPLVLKASLPNQEAGFVKTGMPVKIKFDAYPYQDYGIVQGKVTSISPDVKPDEKLGAVYEVEVTLDRNYVRDDRQRIPFKAGQTATADIIIRRRRIADVFLAPIKQLQKSGLDL
ncbi:HlyD family efflux transporter periplasmic adaptor subunit [Kamptonema formosum]|uniref:HlyD family efflux transporter periplasmic adaptor subunit n=1 Tax=Kamptonema formosum TaxID=331992 RepID=UPI00035DB319|nr:HlyD family efflux transporter periplasmic adaptor subunit [Oscillatoria sp. PCC 10802]